MSGHRVQVHPSIDGIGREWDVLMARARAPVFYRRPFLRAFERHPLHAVQRVAYILVTDARGRPLAGLPAYLHQGVDPMRVIADHFTHARGRPVLLSHVWHCYDTVLPVRPGEERAARTGLAALREVAQEWGAALYGMANVDAAGPLDRLLARQGLHGVDIDVGWGLSLPRFTGYDDYLASLRGKPRRNLAHDLRLAARDGVRFRRLPAADADLDGFVRLARATAAKHGNSDYYRPGLFQDFVRALGDDVEVLELRLGDRLVCSGLALLDDTRYHFWACGFAPMNGYSAFYAVFDHIMRGAFASGRPWVELGRRNPVFKRRYGLTPRTLTARFAETR
ncbi:GNAT family N-acetyltransferase [Streptomyces laurentii]|uniref:GNAT family N-acetyltransferase n=1 Tax=Streptomyces laurentii TaxID=39478 RepID=UPI00368B04F4